MAVGSIDLVFAALADPTRRDIVARVFREQLSVSVLAAGYPMSFAAVQKHVAVLEKAGLVTKQRHGRQRIVRGEVSAVRVAVGLLDDYERTWRDRIGRIDHLLSTPVPVVRADPPPEGVSP